MDKKTLDRTLDEIAWRYRCGCPRHTSEANTMLRSLIAEVGEAIIGEDEKKSHKITSQYYVWASRRNDLRSEQRTTLKELTGGNV